MIDQQQTMLVRIFFSDLQPERAGVRCVSIKRKKEKLLRKWMRLVREFFSFRRQNWRKLQCI